jgi:hypothetical protein
MCENSASEITHTLTTLVSFASTEDYDPSTIKMIFSAYLCQQTKESIRPYKYAK